MDIFSFKISVYWLFFDILMTESSTDSHVNDPKPRYWEFLSEEDKEGYWKLRTALASPVCKNRRNKSIQTFNEVITMIKNYVVRNDDKILGRSLVCGIIWLEDGVAINTHQLRMIISKCKSSINGSFQALGYGTIPTGADSAGELIRKFPFMRNNFAELRQWTVRQKVSKPMKLSEIVSKVPIPNQNFQSQPEDPSSSVSFPGLVIGVDQKSSFEPQINYNEPFLAPKESEYGYFEADQFSFVGLDRLYDLEEPNNM